MPSGRMNFWKAADIDWAKTPNSSFPVFRTASPTLGPARGCRIWMMACTKTIHSQTWSSPDLTVII